MKKKFLILLMALIMVFSSIPISAMSEKEMKNADKTTGENVVLEEEIKESIEGLDGESVEDGEESDNPSKKAKKAAAKYKVSYLSVSSSDKSKISEETLKTGMSFTAALSYMNDYAKNNSSKSSGLVVRASASPYKICAMKKGICFAAPYLASSGASTLTLQNSYGGQSMYISAYDMMFYYQTESLSKVKVGVSGQINYAKASQLIMIPNTLVNTLTTSKNSSTKKYQREYYIVKNGELFHYISNLTDSSKSKFFESGEKSWLVSLVVDKKPSFMKTGTKYYSMDGCTFYSSSSLSSSSKVGTFYPYFKYLPYRTRTYYTATQLNKYINAETAKNSKLRKQGLNLIRAQNLYGVNALMELSFANLESAYGTSWFALNRNNLFGIAAYDSNPNNAYSFSSAKACIYEHAYRWLSRGYFDASTDGRYYGTSPGNKAFGVTVKYASDPYHGEKIGGISYRIDKYLGSKDYKRYSIGLTKVGGAKVYKSASTSSKVLYTLSTKSSTDVKKIPIVILGTSGSFYRIQSDMGVNGNSCVFSNKYWFDRSYGYIKKSDVTKIISGKLTGYGGNNQLRYGYIKTTNGKKTFLSGIDPSKMSYTVKVPKKYNKIKITMGKLMYYSKVSGAGTKTLPKNKGKTYKVKVKSKNGKTRTYKFKIVRK